MNQIDKCVRYNHFEIILNQGHYFKYFKELTRQPYRENLFSLSIEIVEVTSKFFSLINFYFF